MAMTMAAPTPAVVDFETSIRQFLELGRRLQDVQPLTAEHALNELVRWYQSTRIQGAELDKDGDMLLLQWGTTKPPRLTEPTDLRQFANYDMSFWEETDYLFIDLTRQVFVRQPDSEAEFDDSAVQMRITLCYEPDAPKQRGSNIWVAAPGDLIHCLARFRAVPFVNDWLTKPATRTAVRVGHCG